MDLKSIKEIALSNVLSPTYEYIYRYVCRWYSKKFNTPLTDVYKISMYDLFLNYFEEYYESLSAKEDWSHVQIEEIRRAIDPNYEIEEEESLKKFIEKVEKEAKISQKGQSYNKAAAISIDSSDFRSAESPSSTPRHIQDKSELYSITEEDMRADMGNGKFDDGEDGA